MTLSIIVVVLCKWRNPDWQSKRRKLAFMCCTIWFLSTSSYALERAKEEVFGREWFATCRTLANFQSVWNSDDRKQYFYKIQQYIVESNGIWTEITHRSYRWPRISLRRTRVVSKTVPRQISQMPFESLLKIVRDGSLDHWAKNTFYYAQFRSAVSGGTFRVGSLSHWAKINF